MDRELRQTIVEAFPDFLGRCTRGHVVLETVAAKYALPSYLLGLLNTAYLSAERWPVTEADLRRANPGSERSRFGPEHWSHLVECGLAAGDHDAWTLTPAGSATVVELHDALRAEVARREAPEEIVRSLRSQLAPIAAHIPSSRKISAIRELWPDDVPHLTRLYRTVWEFYLYRRVAADERYYAAWPTGENLAMLASLFATLLRELR